MNTLNGYSKSTLTDKYVLTASGGHRPINDSEFIVGTQTAATGSWTGATTDAELYDGKQITYWLPFAGSGNASLNLTFPDNTTSGAIPCYYGGTSRLTTHYGAGNTVRLTYRKNVTVGSTTIAEGWWADSNYTDGNTYTSAYCGTSAGTAAKTATCTNYKLLTNSYLHLTVVYANTSQTALTLNVNSQGAKPLYINGVVSSNTNYTLPAGTYLIYYDGTNYYLRTDGYIPTRPLGYTLIKYTIDASALNEDTYYPVTFKLDPGNTSPNVRIECIVSLDSGSKPSWSTHNSGFSVRKIWETNGAKWGCSAVVRTIYASNYEWCGSDPVRGVGQLTNSSTEYVYVRGGGVYFFYTTHNVIPMLRTSTYTIADQTVQPTTTAPDTFSSTFVTTAVLNAYKNVTVSQHTGNDTNYPLVWSNQNNTNSAHANQLFKSWSDLYYNPKNKKLTTGTYVAVTGVTTPKVESSATTLIINSGTDLYLKRANDDSKSLVLNTTSFKPFDTANSKLDLGSTTARWKDVYVNKTVNITNKAGGADTGVIVEGSSNKLGFMIGSGNVNRGIYDYTNSKWIFYKDGSATYITDWTGIGSSTKPVYFTGGKPVACTYSLNKTVPSDAVFTDRSYASYASYKLPATAGWYRIATTAESVSNCVGLFQIVGAISGYHTACTLQAGTSYNTEEATNLAVLSAHHYTSGALSKARIVYKSNSWSGQYAYLEVYNANNQAITLNVKLVDGTGWTLINTSTSGSIPSGYTNKEAALENETISSSYFKGSLLGNASGITGYTFKTLTAKSTSGWTNNTTDDKIIPTMSFIAYWNGAYSGTSSNLTYCNKGTFGDAAVKGVATSVTSGSTSLVTSGGVYTYVNSFSGINKTGTVTSVTLTAGSGIGITDSGTAITTSGTRTITNTGVRSTTINGNYLRVNTNGTNADLTIPYATYANSAGELSNKFSFGGGENKDKYFYVGSITLRSAWSGYHSIWSFTGAEGAWGGLLYLGFRASSNTKAFSGVALEWLSLTDQTFNDSVHLTYTDTTETVGEVVKDVRICRIYIKLPSHYKSTSVSVVYESSDLTYSKSIVTACEGTLWGTSTGNRSTYSTTATKVGSSTVGGTYQPIYLNSGTATAGTSYAKAIKAITRSGTTFTYTCLDGTTGTFTQQDNNSTYNVYGKTIDGNFSTKYRTQTKGNTTNGWYLSAIRNDTASVTNSPRYGTGVAFGVGDTHGYLYMNYNSAEVYAGAGNEDKLNWVGQLAFKTDIPTKTSQLTNDSGFVTGGPYLPLSGGTMTGTIVSKTGNLVGIKIGDTYLTSVSGELLLQNNSSIRFGGSTWDWNIWAGLKYDHSAKTIHLGLADGTVFSANNAQSGGKVKFPGVSDVYVNRLTISSTEGSVKHLQFSRGSYNYISAPSGGTIVMLPNGASASSSTGMTFTSAGFYPQTTKGYSLGTTSYRWSTVYGDCGNFTGAITSSLTTGSHLKGNQGTAIINSTAAAGYNMLARMKSTNGVFTTGAYNAAFMLYYTADSTITAGTNGTTKNVTLLDESGDSYFSRQVQSSYFKSTVTTGTQPYACTSTTCNTNLNADLLDGTHKSGLLTSVTSDATTNLSVVVGGTTKSVTDLYARKLVKSTNTITSTAQDTTANWGALNNTMHYYNSVQLTDQPTQYGLLLNFNNGASEVHQIWMTQASGSLYHRGGNASGWSGSWRRIIDSSDASSVKTWTASIKGQTWSRLCKVDYATSIVGSSYIINIKGTRNSVVYNNTYMVTAHHSGKGNVVAIGSSNYTEVTVRVCVDSTGNSYFELKDSAKSIATSTSQSVYCTLVPIGCGSVTQYTSFTSGATLDSGYTAGTELITRTIDSCIHAANFSASAITRSAEFALQKNTSTQSYMHTYISTVGTTSTGGVSYLKIGNAIATGSVDNSRGILCVYGTGKSGAQIKCDSTLTEDYELMLPAAAGRLVYHTTGSQIGSGTKPIYVSSVGKATASTSTIGNGSNPVYLSAGTITACSYPKSGAYFQGVPSVSSGGVTEIGRYLDFHPTNTSTLDFSARLDCGTSTTARTITLPDYPGTLLLHHGSMTRNTSDDTHAKAISDYFTTNKTTMPRNMLHSLYSPAYGNGSCAFGYLLNGYDTNPFGGYFVSHYKKAWYVGIDNGSYQQYRIATATTETVGSSQKPVYLNNGVLTECEFNVGAMSTTSATLYSKSSSFTIYLTRFKVGTVYLINIRAIIPSVCYDSNCEEIYTSSAKTTAYTLPSGYRPAHSINHCFWAASSGNENESACNIAIWTNGKLRLQSDTTINKGLTPNNDGAAGLNLWYLGTTA